MKMARVTNDSLNANRGKLRLGFLSSHNYYDRNSFSGVPYSMHRTLVRDPGVELAPLGEPYRPDLRRRVLGKLGWNPRALSLRDGDHAQRCRRFARDTERKLAKRPCDAIFAPVGSAELFELETDTPIIYYSDATHRLYERHYDIGLSAEQSRRAEQQEQAAIDKSAVIVYPSEWAAQSAIEDYGAAPSKVRVIPWGPSIDELPDASRATTSRQPGGCRLLFIGKDWQRKGGAIALEACRLLQRQGLDAELTIIGCDPPEARDEPGVSVVPFLDKRKPADRERFEELLFGSNFFLFPTRADCSPIVICESVAYGLPVVAAAVGGLPSMVKPDESGFLLPADAGPDAYAEVIASAVRDAGRYERLVDGALRMSREVLNWNAWRTDLIRATRDVVSRRPEPDGASDRKEASPDAPPLVAGPA